MTTAGELPCIASGNTICDASDGIRVFGRANRVVSPDGWLLCGNQISASSSGIHLHQMRKGKGQISMPTDTAIALNTIVVAGSGAACVRVDDPEDIEMGETLLTSSENIFFNDPGAFIALWGREEVSTIGRWQDLTSDNTSSRPSVAPTIDCP